LPPATRCHQPTVDCSHRSRSRDASTRPAQRAEAAVAATAALSRCRHDHHDNVVVPLANLAAQVVSTPREAFYWLTVLVTFALGTAAGDWTLDLTGWGLGRRYCCRLA
jgi:hypothetical protein